MGKRDDFIIQLKPIINDKEILKNFIIENSNLPGPRGNLELAFAFADVYGDFNTLQEWISITEDMADVNDPKSFLAFCSAVCLGKLYTKKKNTKIISILKNSANDGRWRMREAVAFGFQIIGENDFDEMKRIFSDWIKKSNNFEKRAILVSLAHPPILNEYNAEFCFDITDIILKQLNNDIGFEVLKKGLDFTISVFAAANPKTGFRFIEKWIGKDKVIDKIMKENLKKNRLIKKNPEMVKKLISEIA